VRIKACRSLIWGSAFKAAACGLVPGLEIASYVILTETIDILLFALYNADLKTTKVASGLLSAASLIARGSLLLFGFVSKALKVSIVLMVGGIVLSTGTNFIGVVASGYLTWYKIAPQVQELTNVEEI